MKTIELSELLNDGQINRVTEILDSKGYIWERDKELKKYLSQFRSELEAKGVLPEYLAYVLIAKHQQII